MAKIVYFVVGVDLDNKLPFIDDEMFIKTFEDNKALHDTTLRIWRKEDYETEYLPALEILNTVKLAKE